MIGISSGARGWTLLLLFPCSHGDLGVDFWSESIELSRILL